MIRKAILLLILLSLAIYSSYKYRESKILERTIETQEKRIRLYEERDSLFNVYMELDRKAVR